MTDDKSTTPSQVIITIHYYRGISKDSARNKESTTPLTISCVVPSNATLAVTSNLPYSITSMPVLTTRIGDYGTTDDSTNTHIGTRNEMNTKPIDTSLGDKVSTQ